MSDVTLADIEKWDPAALREVFSVTYNRILDLQGHRRRRRQRVR